MDSVELSNMQLDGNLIYISKWTGVKLQNMSVTNITSIQSYILYFSDSSVDLISNTSITNTKKTGMLVSNTNITEVSTLTLKDVAHGVVVQSKSTISSLHNSSLTKVGSLDVSNGGALDIIDSAVSLSNSRFEQNQAQSGAAISVRCSNYDLWNNQFSSSSFINNTAEVQGGAIYYKTDLFLKLHKLYYSVMNQNIC